MNLLVETELQCLCGEGLGPRLVLVAEFISPPPKTCTLSGILVSQKMHEVYSSLNPKP